MMRLSAFLPALMLVLAALPAWSDSVLVDGAGHGQHLAIQEGIDAAGPDDKANDITGSPMSISARTTPDVALMIDASYNYWGQTQCEAFLPRFVLDASMPDEAFTFLPFTDVDHIRV